MTRDREFDRLARAWLDLMPDEVPDRAIAAVLDAVERTPQVRRRVDWLRWRESPMTRLSLTAAAAAAVLIAVGGAVMLLRPSGQGPGIGGEPTPLPTPSSSAPASVTPGAGGTPEALRGVWLGDLRVVPGLPTDRSVLEFGESELVYIETQRSDVAAPSPTELTLTAVNAIAGCEIGDIGTYQVALSPGATRLTLTSVADDCSARAAAIAGDWIRSDCSNPDNWCLGPLEAGEYPSYFFAPRLGLGETWAPQFGALRYEVPVGWAATSDYPREYFLEPADWYASNGGDIAKETRGIYVASHVIAYDESGGCGAPIASDVSGSAEELATWLADHPGLDAAAVQPTTVDGIEAWMVEASLDTEWEGICQSAPTPVGILFGETAVEGEARQWGAIVDHRNRWILLDAGADSIVVIEISGKEEQFDALLPEAMAIVESFRFE